MATANYETVLAQARQLTPQERQQLREELARQLASEAAHVVRPGLEADLKALDELAAEIGSAWTSEKSAPEAVSEQRR